MATEIHPTAILDSRAAIGKDVIIGPYCVVEGPVQLGDRCALKSHVVLAGPSKIGPDNVFYPFAVVGEQSQDLKYIGEPTYLEIGHHNVFRENVTIHRSTADAGKTLIGNHGNFLAYSHIAHDCVVGDHVIFSNNGTLAGHVTVEDHAVIGGLTAVHQFCKIGQHAITGGCTKIVQDVPPFMIVDGNPAGVRGINKVGLERHGFEDTSIRALRECYKLLYRQDMNVHQALEAIAEQFPDDSLVQKLTAFVASSERGIIR
ncbi:MAG: UDP-N-acetylglucosamine acyltransferase [Verrucomicrobiales bacterium]|jgi:UDP-N-acetylglucosamine acyltransferase